MKLLQFRFWHTERQRMYRVFGLLGDLVYCVRSDVPNEEYKFEKNQGKLMQYIGRKDMDNTPIYENDFVTQEDKSVDGYTIVKVGHLFCMQDAGKCIVFIPFSGDGKLKVIGNIFETPYIK